MTCNVRAGIPTLQNSHATFLSYYHFNIHYEIQIFAALILGIGLGIITICSRVIVQQYFDKNRALAAGISAIGISVGNMAGAPITQLLMDHYGWRGALIIISGVTLHLLIVCAAYRPLNIYSHGVKKNTVEPSLTMLSRVTKNISDFSIFKNVPFTMFTFGAFFVGAGAIPFIHHMTSHAVFYGIDRQKAALLNTAFSVSALCARLATSFLANSACVNRLLINGVGSLLAGICVVFYSFAVTYPLMMGIGACIGILHGNIFTTAYM